MPVGLHSQHFTHTVTALLALHATATTEEYALTQNVSTRALFMLYSKPLKHQVCNIGVSFSMLYENKQAEQRLHFFGTFHVNRLVFVC